ncbi:MAG: lysine--tRNA ligase [Gammaproteobacteria bacterium]|nr:lysine--tRNA ligase [Gammaproteobacteria bacterium]
MSAHADNDLSEQRRAKLRAWRARGDAYPNDFRRTDFAADLHERLADKNKEALAEDNVEAAVAGRIMLRRMMGKACFLTIEDMSGRIQVYARLDGLGQDAYADIEGLMDLGDIVGVRGTMMRTMRGELTVEATSIELLSKCLHPPPEKFHGLVDQEMRYRARYLDLMVNEASRQVFRLRSTVVSAIRAFFEAHDFFEVETPMMQPVASGAAARPFTTHHNALDMPLYLRVAPELYLKRLVVGGFERVFEINRNFRNEGLSTRHNPEFTMLEFYQAYASVDEVMALTTELIHEVAARTGRQRVTVDGKEIDLSADFDVIAMEDAVCEYTGLSLDDVWNVDALRRALGDDAPDKRASAGELLFALFEARVEPHLVMPTYVTGYPSEVSPLSRANDDRPEIVDRFELFVGGREIANGFSELNDPDEQLARFHAQEARRAAGDAEAMRIDHDYVRALEYGLPPTGGQGLGIDRLVMLLSGASTIRDVLLFPLLKPEGGGHGD